MTSLFPWCGGDLLLPYAQISVSQVEKFTFGFVPTGLCDNCTLRSLINSHQIIFMEMWD